MFLPYDNIQRFIIRRFFTTFVYYKNIIHE